MVYVTRLLARVVFAGMPLLLACSGTDGGAPSGQGGAPATGGSAHGSGGDLGSGGQGESGGASGSGGTSRAGSTMGGGGALAAGGQAADGGRTASGGGFVVGGARATGGGVGNGGATAGGGVRATGGSHDSGTGGWSAGGGSAGGGAPGGSTAMGGQAATGGAPGRGGASGTGGSTAPACGAIASTPTRPQLSSSEAANYTTAKYLAGSDNWNPTAGISLPGSPSYTVAKDGSGDATTVNGALAKATGGSRVNILVKPGTYREKININGSTPITLYGADADASKVVIVYGDSSDSAGGTSKSATFTVSNPAFQAKNLTFANDLDENGSGCSNCQAVAFYSTGDKLVFDNVRFTGNQDTVYFETTGTNTVARVYLKNCFVQGDTDYIFGRATVVLEDSEMNYTSLRKPTNAGRQFAPSTSASNKYGYLFNRCTFTADAGTLTNKIYLGRSWDQNVASAAEWNAATSPNGQAVVRESVLGAHIRLADPWAAAATSGREYNASTNRFFEYCNSGPGAGG